MKFTDRLRCFPPILCRLLAIKDGRAPTANEIAEASGQMPDITNLLSTGEVITMSKLTNWKGVGIHEALAFQRGTVGCFDDRLAMRKLDDYLAHKPQLGYLRRSEDWESYFKPLLIRWRSTYPYNICPGDMPHAHLRQLLNRLTPLTSPHNNDQAH